MRRSPLILVAVLASVAIGAGVMMVPQGQERVTMLMRDGRFETALREAQEAAVRDPTLLLRVAELNERYGDQEAASEAMQAYLRHYPNDVTGWKHAVRLYEGVFRLHPLLEALQRVVTLQPEPETIDRLLRLYRLHGLFARELALLASLDVAHLTATHRERHAGLLFAAGDLQGSARLLRALDDELAAEVRSARLLLFDVLVASGELREAAERATGWVRQWPDTARPFLLALARSDVGEDLLLVAQDLVAAIGSKGASSLGVLVETRRQDLLILAIRRMEVAHQRLRGRDFRRYAREILGLAVAQGLGPVVLDELRRTAPRGRPAVTGILAQECLAAFGYDTIAHIRPLLTRHVLAAQPLLGASLSLAEGNLPEARRYLLAVDLSDLAPQDVPAWKEVLAGVGIDALLVDQIAAAAPFDDLSTEVRVALLDLMMRTGARRHLAAMRATWRRSETSPAVPQ